MTNRHLASNQRAPLPPKPKPALAFNPDAPINSTQRSKNALPRVTDFDPVRSFNRWELDELRADILGLADTLRRDRLITLIDAFTDAEDYRAEVQAALDAAELDRLVDKVTEAEEAIHGELARDSSDDEIDELLTDHPGATPAQLRDHFKVWHAEEISRLKKEVTEALKPLTKAIEASREALRRIDPDV